VKKREDPMIIKMKESGFCGGVQAAINKANEYLATNQKVYAFGNLVNNTYVMQGLKDKGLDVIEDINLVPSGSIIIIRAHGVPQQVFKALEQKDVTVVDCTCPSVTKIHKIVKESSSKGDTIVVVGKKGHPEVIGICGWCEEKSQVIIAEELIDVFNCDLFGEDVTIVGQTTCNRELWDEVVKFMSGVMNYPIQHFHFIDTLCQATSLREQKAKEIAKTVDTMIVVGDKSSSNSRELYKICEAHCKNTVFVTSLKDLIDDPQKVLAPVIGLAGSASTPTDVIEDIYKYLTFLQFLNKSKNEIEEALNIYFEDLISKSLNGFIFDALKSLHNQCEGGKRIRGAMIKLGGQIAGSSGKYLPIAMGYELFQTAILIHDDIIDNSKTRRGKPTIHAEIALSHSEHFGISNAICIGDYGFFIANRLLFESNLDPSIMVKVAKLYTKIQSITCEGEIMDVVLPYKDISITEDYAYYTQVVTQIFEYKTAWYTLAGPIMLGAICGDADDTLLELLKNITIPLGIAFQIKDDLLGIYSSEKVLGKSVLSDIIEKKQTLIYGYAYKHADSMQQQQLDDVYGKATADMHDLELVKQIFELTGAKKYAEDEIIRLSNISKELINSPLINDEGKTLLMGLIHYLCTRTF